MLDVGLTPRYEMSHAMPPDNQDMLRYMTELLQAPKALSYCLTDVCKYQCHHKRYVTVRESQGQKKNSLIVIQNGQQDFHIDNLPLSMRRSDRVSSAGK